MSRLVLLLLLFGSFLSRSAVAGDEPLTDDEREALSWFSTLDFPDVADRPFVRVATGRWRQVAGQEPKNHYAFGFLVERGDGQFRVFFLDLQTSTFLFTEADVPEHKRIGYERADLLAEAERRLTELREPSDDSPWPRFGARLGMHAETFVVAWACWRKGHPDRAHELLAAVRSKPVLRGEVPEGSWRDILARQLGHAMMWGITVDFGRPDVTRQDLLRRLNWFCRHFKTSRHIERAEKTRDLLARMVKEDADHRKNERSWDELSRKERIAELIFRLRDQNGRQWSQPGSCDIFADPRGEKSPAHRLRAMGKAAIPQLIEAVDDRRFTRSVGFHRDFYFSHHVLRVGDVAVDIISSIAGRRFTGRGWAKGGADGKEEGSPLKRAIRHWWAEVQKRGEKQVLIEGVERGDGNSRLQALRLLKLDPEAAGPAILRGAKAAEDDWDRAALIRLLGRTGVTPEARTFLLAELEQSARFSSRVAAADLLHREGEPRAFRTMIRVWKEIGKETRDAFDDRAEATIAFLVRCRRTEALHALEADFFDRPVADRVEIVDRLALVHRYGSGSETTKDSPLRHPESKLAPIRERILIRAMEDTTVRSGLSGSMDGVSYQDPRVCDLAAHHYAVDREEVRFDMGADRSTRDRQRFAIINRWRKKQGKEPLPEPEAFGVERVPDETVDPALQRIVEEGTPEAIEAFLSLGLGTLPRLRERIRTTAPSDPTHPVLVALANQVGLIVRKVRIEHRPNLPDAVRKGLKRMLGAPLNDQALLRHTALLLGNLPAGTGGLTLEALRPSDGTGFTITITFHPGGESSPTGWSTHSLVTVGGKSLLSRAGASGLQHGLKKKAFKELLGATGKALKAPWDQDIRIRHKQVLHP